MPEHEKELTVAKDVVGRRATWGRKSVSAETTNECNRVWHLYVLECSDQSLYCGIALDVQKRLTLHQNGRGARYTRSRLPVTLLTSTVIGPNVGEALKAETRFKALSRAKKLKALEGRPAMLA